jgi:hypothetical protein
MVADEKCQRHADAISAMRTLQDLVAVIWKFTGVTVYSVRSDEIRQTANPRRLRPRHFAVPPTDLGYGMLRVTRT